MERAAPGVSAPAPTVGGTHAPPARKFSAPVALALIGSACTSSSAIVVRLAGQAAGTTGFYRCALAVPGLALLAGIESRRLGGRASRDRLAAAGAGVFLGVDLVLWAHSIYDVGAGVATVLGNLQVIFVAAIAWVVMRERPQRDLLIALPVVAAGVVLVGGLAGGAAAGDRPLAGVSFGVATSLSYALFIILLRRTAGNGRHGAGVLLDATVGAALAALVLGAVLGEMNFSPPLGALGWLAVLALTSQTIGWLLITSALPRLPAVVSALLLLFQPACSLVLAAVVLSEVPGALQVLGAVMVCCGVLLGARTGRPARAPAVWLDQSHSLLGPGAVVAER